jgi:hypothetical protein
MAAPCFGQEPYLLRLGGAVDGGRFWWVSGLWANSCHELAAQVGEAQRNGLWLRFAGDPDIIKNLTMRNRVPAI